MFIVIELAAGLGKTLIAEAGGASFKLTLVIVTQSDVSMQPFWSIIIA